MASTISSPVAGYSFEGAANLSEPETRTRLSASAIKTFMNIVQKWGLNEAQSRGLLGGIASSTFHGWRAHPELKHLSQDELTRISLVIGIYKALSIYFGEPWADQWVTLGNRGALFNGRAPIEYMVNTGLPGILGVRRMLDAWRGGR
jgi:hypothetical protein